MSPGGDEKAKVQDLMKAGVATDIIVGYVMSRHISFRRPRKIVIGRISNPDEGTRAALPAKNIELEAA